MRVVYLCTIMGVHTLYIARHRHGNAIHGQCRTVAVLALFRSGAGSCPDRWYDSERRGAGWALQQRVAEAKRSVAADHCRRRAARASTVVCGACGVWCLACGAWCVVSGARANAGACERGARTAAPKTLSIAGSAGSWPVLSADCASTRGAVYFCEAQPPVERPCCSRGHACAATSQPGSALGLGG
jgi:hypothetical protein